MEILRTPDNRFRQLPGYPFAPRYLDVDGVRMHYVDEGPRDSAPVLLLHGEPSWSYLYRKIIPLLTVAGHRAVAPDLVGFGRSDKPVRREDYTYQRHVDWTRGVIEQLDLRGITLVCQDWGGLIGLRLAAEHDDRFGRIVTSNTFLPTGDVPPGDAFLAWRKFSQEAPEFPSAASSRAGVSLAWRRKWSPPTTHLFLTIATRPGRGNSLRSCRSRRTISRQRRTGKPGKCCVAGGNRS
jgi:haloalkane dehalogenase